MTLSVVNPESGTATEEVGATYTATPLEIGFNARYLLDITSQIEGKEVRFLLSDAGSPDHHRGHGGQAHALRPHADAGVTALTSPTDQRALSGAAGRADCPRANLAVTRLHADEFPLLCLR